MKRMTPPIRPHHTYRPVRWRCTVCGRIGQVLFQEDDTPEQQDWRLTISHKANRPRSGTVKRICLEPVFVRSKAR